VRRGQKVQAAEVGMTVLKVLGQLGGAASLTNLSARLEENPAKVHRYLSSLVSSGFVYQDPATGRYVLGAEAIILGLAAQRQSDPLTLAGAEIGRLVESLNVSCFVAVMSNQGPVIVRWEEPVHAIVINARVGSVMPLLWSATGLAFAAFERSDLIDTLIAQELASASAEQRRKLPNRKAVDTLIAGYRRQGCTWVENQILRGINAVAAPVFIANGHVAAAIVAIGVSDSFDVRPNGPNAIVLRESARKVSERLGYLVPRKA
jgi:DNA-binding IclR family transcriptional regulator